MQQNVVIGFVKVFFSILEKNFILQITFFLRFFVLLSLALILKKLTSKIWNLLDFRN